MLFTQNLDQLIFNRHENLDINHLTVLSGYVWPNPVLELNNLPFNSTVIYGMYWAEWIRRQMHESLKRIQEESDWKITILYSQIPVHSKCYLWKNNNNVCSALIGSANFSTNWLTTPYREVLAEPKEESFWLLDSYIEYVLNHSINCNDDNVWIRGAIRMSTEVNSINISPSGNCLLSLLWRDWEVQNAAWLNRWQNPSNHTTSDDAYIKIRTIDVHNFPDLFPPKQENPNNFDWQGRSQRHNDAIDIVWDDWTSMRWLLEWSQAINWIMYPKQISSFPQKSELWRYMRRRLWVLQWNPVRRSDLERYWRLDIEVSLIWEWIYYFDFSV